MGKGGGMNPRMTLSELKKETNNFLWVLLDEDTTLKEAESIAIDITTKITKNWKDKDNKREEK